MRTMFRSIMAIALAAMTFAACEDVPEPYAIPGNNDKKQDPVVTGNLPYSSTNLKTDWNLHAVTADQPWSQGNTYTQATGYQKWDGADTKSNRAVEGWLISPVFNTTGANEVKISFDHTIKYTNNVPGWEAYHKIYASNNYDGTNVSAADWKEVSFTPVASPYTDWTLYSSGEIQLPAEMANQEKVYVAFWFKAPADASTTWELENFKIEEGKASSEQGQEGGDTPDPTPTEGGEGDGTEATPYNVTAAIAAATGTGIYVKGFIVGTITDKSISSAIFGTDNASQTNVILAASADETDIAKCMPIQLPTGAVRTALNLQDNPANYKKEVTLYGNIEKYFGATGMKSVTFALLEGTEIGTKPGGTTPDPTPTGAAYTVDFKTGMADWTINDKNKPAEIDAIWKNNNKYGMVATGYVSSSKTNYDSESWMISPAINMSGRTTATLKIHHAINFFTSVDVAKTEIAVMASTDGNEWTALTLSNWPDKLSWTFFDSTADMAAFAGKSNVQIALKYTSTAAKAGTWEVETITIE